MKDRRELIIIRGTGCRRYILAKDVKPMAVVRNRLYRVDESLAKNTTNGKRSMIIYRQDSTQPIGRGEYLDPDITMAMVDTGRSSPSKAATTIPKFNPQLLLYGAIAVVIIYALITGGIR